MVIAIAYFSFSTLRWIKLIVDDKCHYTRGDQHKWAYNFTNPTWIRRLRQRDPIEIFL